jgi:hypothetical protein
MPDRAYYRFYCVSPRGRFVGVEETHCETDEDAREHARRCLEQKVHCRSIEVWRREVLVCHVSRDDAD